MKFRLFDPKFSYADMSEDMLRNMYQTCHPHGSGPLGSMQLVCALIENIAHLRGFDVSEWERIVIPTPK